MSTMNPPHLSRGGTIGVVSLGSPCLNRMAFEQACSWWESQGYNLKLSKHLNIGSNYLSGTPQQRAYDFNSMVRDDAVDAIIAARGGCGSAGMVELIDFDAFSANPKPFMGFSDNTSVHLALAARTNTITFHGPVIMSFCNDLINTFTCDSALRILTSANYTQTVDLPTQDGELRTFCEGKCQGPIIGGNLARVCGSLGTPFEIDTTEKILLLEECSCEPWVALDFLTHLQCAGKFDNVAGVVIGAGYKVESKTTNPTYPKGSTFEDMLESFFDGVNFPVLYGLPLGHTPEMATIPLGATAILDACHQSLVTYT